MELLVTTSEVRHPRDYRMVFAIAAVVALLFNGLLVGWGLWRSSQVGHVSLTNLHVIGDASLCPGELLVYDFNMMMSRPATIDVKTTIERVDPALKVITSTTYTSLQQFHVYQSGKMAMRRNVYFGETYTDPETGRQKYWIPGMYRQRTTASILGRNEYSEIEVPFRIRNDCSSKPKE